MNTRIDSIFDESIALFNATKQELTPTIEHAASAIVQCLLSDGKILACGDGISTSLVQHFSSLMLNRIETERPSLPAIALTTDHSTIASITNDYGLNETFSKQIRALGHEKDALLVITTCGNSANIVQAVQAAHDREIMVIALTGQEGGDIARLLTSQDIEVRVPATNEARILEAQLLILHTLCSLVDSQLFGDPES
ncbi:MAG: phosphoheptose isomerase [Gammaproteobacteria bacterium]|nr:MAG: phosphoheptose isomerase [Gammaproteobacteria bacterium]